jgi:predicted nucleic acid-binding protein
MTPDCFIDTNVLVYAALGRLEEQAKHERAALIIAQTDFVVSAQVLQEFYATALRKARTPFTHELALRWVERLTERCRVDVDHSLVIAAARLSDRYRISYWDGAVVAAAERAQAPILYSEDLSDGQTYGTVRVANPFKNLN